MAVKKISEPTQEEIDQAESEVAQLFAAAQAMNAEEARIAALPPEEQVELVQWTIEEAIGILRYTVSRGKRGQKFIQEDKINGLIDKIEESTKL